jgi:endonuclease/exonuclease/phosphatase family metal-dependent hydrolase
LLRTTERGTDYAQVNRPLVREFGGVLAGLEWDFALLQEAPPRWLEPLGRACGASGVAALTSRNSLAALRAALAELNPDLIASNEGGSNQVLVRAPWSVVSVARRVLTLRPERRVLLLVRAADAVGDELCVGCLHASRGPRPAARDIALAARIATDWAGSRPLLLGGDFNVRPEEDRTLYDGLGLGPALTGSVDQIVSRGLDPREGPTILPPPTREVRDRSGLRLRLSDHPVVAATFGMK